MKKIFTIIFVISVLLITSSLVFLNIKNNHTQKEGTTSDSLATIACFGEFSFDGESTTSCKIMDDLVLTYYPAQKVEVKRVSTGAVLNQFVCGNDIDCEYNREIDVDDINNDGFEDLGITINGISYNRTVNFFIFNKDKDAYEPVEELSYLVNPKVNPQYNEVDTIVEVFLGNAHGDSYTQQVHKLQFDGSYKRIEKCQDDRWSDAFEKYSQSLKISVCHRLDAYGIWRVSENNFDGLGNEMVRQCPSFDCKIIQYGALIPKVNVLEQRGDWYKVNYVEKGAWGGTPDDNETVISMPKEHWIYTEGWIYKTLVPEEQINRMKADTKRYDMRG